MKRRSEGDSQDEQFARLTEEFYSRVRALVTRFTRTEEDRDDLTQEVFLNLYKGLGGFRGDASLGTWVYRVAWTTCVASATRIRTEARRRWEPASADRGERSAEEEEERFGVIAASQLEAANAKERSLALHQAIADLPNEMRRVVLMRLQDRKYNEIATILQRSEETVKKQLSLARARLRAVLGEAFRDEDV